MAQLQESQPPSGEMMMITLNDGNVGDHPVRGTATKTSYGYRKSGDTFLVDARDVVAQPHKFIQPKVEEPRRVLRPELPPPPEPYDFTKLKGVGDKTADELRKMGVRTLNGLIALGEDRLSDILPKHTAAKVIDQAKKELTAVTPR